MDPCPLAGHIRQVTSQRCVGYACTRLTNTGVHLAARSILGSQIVFDPCSTCETRILDNTRGTLPSIASLTTAIRGRIMETGVYTCCWSHLSFDIRPVGHQQVIALTTRMSFKPQRNDAAKYSKFAYSASLGFSLPTDPTTIRGMGADSTLLSSRDGKVWQARRECSAEVLQSGIIRSVWRPFGEISVFDEAVLKLILQTVQR